MMMPGMPMQQIPPVQVPPMPPMHPPMQGGIPTHDPKWGGAPPGGMGQRSPNSAWDAGGGGGGGGWGDAPAVQVSPTLGPRARRDSSQ